MGALDYNTVGSALTPANALGLPLDRLLHGVHLLASLRLG